MWKASGHIENFHDPMIDCTSCKKRFRVDDDNIDTSKPCSHCGNTSWTDVRNFNLMFKTNLGALEDGSSVAYLRPETAQTIFVNFKNVVSTSRAKLPFGISQIGKAFRNEITPKQFLFRMREFEQMEIEWFCKEENAMETFEFWRQKRFDFYKALGVTQEKLRLKAHDKEELAHYSVCTTDVEYEFPFGWKELEGVAHRGTFDLTQHSTHSKKELAILNHETNKTETPVVIESSVGVDRLFLTLLFDGYCEEEMAGETRVVLKLHPAVAPIKAAFFPLTKKIAEPMKEIYNNIKKEFQDIQFDVTGSIGKRYRRQDEIGTPLCFTFDFDSLEDKKVTMRDRDTGEQTRISIDEIAAQIQSKTKISF
jgi:glycyl-tRNA synthetase